MHGTSLKQRARQSCPDGSTFLPICRQDMARRGWDELDILLVSGDAYIDHPAFGVPLLGRVLEAQGYRVGIVAQPRWDTPDDIARMGRPKLFAGISGGSLDSMLAHYTAFRKKRHDDAYTPGGKAGARPNRASIVYTNLIRQAFPGLPVVLGGIEASLRRAAHYDFWTDRLRRSILLDAKADLIAYGMSEQTIMTIADRVRNGEPLEAIPGTCGLGTPPADARALPSFEEIQTTPECLLGASQAIEEQVHHGVGTLVQAHGTRHLVINPPAPLLDTAALDDVYDLPFTRRTHPSYALPVPAEEMIRWSITAVRGCGGGCTFCALALHQGRRVRSRSSQSVLKEVRALTKHPQWKGAISDIGGPTANLWGATCDIAPTDCHRPSCLFPSRCRHLRLSQKDYLSLLRQAKSQPGVKHVRVGSGIRFDLAIEDPAFCDGLTAEFVGGQLKLAPEHSVAHVLRLMRKTDFTLFERFRKLFTSANRRAAKEQYIVPYVMSAFPGCRVEDMKALATWFRQQGWRPQQVQCFVPTPGTIATAMFYSEHAPDGTSIHVARTDREREKQHALLIPRAKRR